MAPPTTENNALLSRRLPERIQPGAVLVLISRAHVVDFDAPTELVLAGRFKAAIDIFPDGAFKSPRPNSHYATPARSGGEYGFASIIVERQSKYTATIGLVRHI
jgi:lactate dehydrogenase-like 2-hydroxyacid dehydrogenase